MRPEKRSQLLLAITRSKAKMFEYGVSEEHHIRITRDPARLLTLAIGLLGDLAAKCDTDSIEASYMVELQKNIRFSAYFFDAYLQSRLNEELNPYLLLLGAASYYLSGLPGSSLVLANHLGRNCPDLGCLGLEELLLWLLKGDFSEAIDGAEGPYRKYITDISHWLIDFYAGGNVQENLFGIGFNLKKTAYNNGTPRQLLFADVICSIVRKRLYNSTWSCLPRYSSISTDRWLHALKKDNFIRELWPAQHLLGENDVFRGKSAIVQMPTSAGKTRATEIIIRSAFLANRTSLAVIVAPFRALCHEIRNSFAEAFRNESVSVDELSDVLQADFDILELTEGKQVLVVTPEKLLYVLRHTPELTENIGLIIYDEGHQFDNGTRGTTYELLLTSLKSMLPEGVQKVLISAVIRNTTSIGKWLSGEDSTVVSGTTLSPTYRTLAFVSWLDRLGRLEFVTPENPDNGEFFVPRIIEQHELELKGRERKKRMFPSKSDGQTIALFLGLRLASSGSVAIFCGKKLTASSLCEKIVDAYDRGIGITKPLEYSDQSEVERLQFLCERNLGTKATATHSATLGIFAHHGNTPQGIRLAVEHAMKEGLVRVVICTSTLAQGVNLPIRYLIVTSVYQGRERIKVRDFHNLLGRAGRAGMHTEGSILFADPAFYDERKTLNNRWRWEEIKELLEPNNSEPCVSTLLSLFEPFHSDDRRYTIRMEPLDFVNMYIESSEYLSSLPGKIASEHADKHFTEDGIRNQISWRMSIISSIESYLMSNWDESGSGLVEANIMELSKGTLAYFLADDKQREQIIELFLRLAQNIERNISEPSRRKTFGKTLYGVGTSIEIESWVKKNIEALVLCEDLDEILSILWLLLSSNIRNKTFRKCDKPNVLETVALGWIHGKSFHELYKICLNANARLIAGTQRRMFKLDHIVDICENAFAYDGTLLIGAVAEHVELISPDNCAEIIIKIQEFQKRLKYGLPSSSSVALYELGFADRAVSMDISSAISFISLNKHEVMRMIKQNNQPIRDVLEKYPSYFQRVMENIMA